MGTPTSATENDNDDDERYLKELEESRAKAEQEFQEASAFLDDCDETGVQEDYDGRRYLSVTIPAFRSQPSLASDALDFFWEGDQELENPVALIEARRFLRAYYLLDHPNKPDWIKDIDPEKKWPDKDFGYKGKVDKEDWVDEHGELLDRGQYARYLRAYYPRHSKFIGLNHVHLVDFVDKRNSITNPLLTVDALRLVYASIRCEWLGSLLGSNDPGDIRLIEIHDRDPKAGNSEDDAGQLCGLYKCGLFKAGTQDDAEGGYEIGKEPFIVIYDSGCFSSQDPHDFYLSLQATLLHEIGHHVFQTVNGDHQPAECMAQWFAHKHTADANHFNERSYSKPPAYRAYRDLTPSRFYLNHEGTGWEDDDLVALLLFQIERLSVGYQSDLVGWYVGWYNSPGTTVRQRPGLVEQIESAVDAYISRERS
jgi:hypothetical protein